MAYKVIDVVDYEWFADKTYPVPPQHGPLRQFEKAMRCASRGCGSSTFYKVLGTPRCMTHALRQLNDMLAGVEDGNSDES